MSVRTAFLEAATLTRSLIEQPVVGTRWHEPSALDRLTIGQLTAHLVRSVTTVATYLGLPDPGIREDLVDAPGYLVSIEGLSAADGPDLDNELHTQIRRRAEAGAAEGPMAVLAAWEAATEELTGRLAVEPPTRAVEVLGSRRILLDQYLITRLVEMTVHGDDLAVSVGLPTPDYPDNAWELVIGCLTEVAIRRHGPLAVVRAMTRSERDDARAMRVL